MMGLDTNILVRLLVRDDPSQTEQAQAFLDTHCTQDSPAFINSVVLAELVWVLANPYGYSRSAIVQALEQLMAGNDRVFEHHDEVRTAVKAFGSSRIDFVDALIAAINRARGCQATATFDRRASRHDGFIHVA